MHTWAYVSMELTFVHDYKPNRHVTLDRVFLSNACRVNHEIQAKHCLKNKETIC